MKLNKLIIFSLTIILTSCMTYLNKNDNPYYFGMKIINNTKLKKSNEVNIYDYTEDNLNYFLDKGYVIKAESSFCDTFINLSWAELAAKQMGSDVVLCKKKYVGISSGEKVIPWNAPGETYPGKLKTSRTVSANGYVVGNSYSSTNGNFNSNITNTVQGPKRYDSSSVPNSNYYYDQFAVFLVKKQNIIDAESGALNNHQENKK